MQQKLLEAALRFQKQEPWLAIEDYVAFAVKDPNSDELGYAAILGHGGKPPGLTLYRGQEGIEFFQQLEDGEIAPDFDDEIVTENSLRLEFLASGKNLTPSFRAFLPNYVPATLDAPETEWLTFALDCACDYVAAMRADSELAKERYYDAYLTYFGRKPTGFDAQWTAVDYPLAPVGSDLPVNELALRKLQSLPVSNDGAWEAGVIYNRAEIVTEGARPWYRRMAVIAHKQTGHIFKAESLHPDRDAGLTLREFLLEVVEKTKLIPLELHVSTDTLWETLKPVTDGLQLRLRMKRFLPALAEIREGLLAGKGLIESPTPEPLRPISELH